MSSPTLKARGSVNQQVKARLSAVRDFLAGRSGEFKLAGADDKSTREVVGAELLAAMAGRNNSEGDRQGAELGDQTQEIRLEAANSEHDQGQSEPGVAEANETRSGNNNYAQDRARELFLEHGYFDEAVENLRSAKSPAERAAAARALGLSGSQELARSGSEGAFSLIVKCFDDHSPQVRNAAARAFRKLEPARTVDLFNRSLEGASAERRRNIGSAIVGSGLATEAIDKLVSENREDTYNALSILFVMAKTGEVAPLVGAIEGHESVQVRMAAIKLLTLTGQAELANSAAKRRLEKLPPELDHLS